MTIKFRNRLISLLCILSLVFLLLNSTIFLIKFFTNSLDLSYFQSFYKNSVPFLFRYNIFYIFAANFLQIFYVALTSFFLYRTFEKTQAKDIIFFYLILIAFLVSVIVTNLMQIKMLNPLATVFDFVMLIHFLMCFFVI